MTDALLQRLNVDPRARYDKTAWAFNYVCGAMAAHATAGGDRFDAGIDVEAAFSAIQMLAERSSHEVAPFVSAWNGALAELERPRVSDMELQRALEGVTRPIAELGQAVSQLSRNARPSYRASHRDGARDITQAITRAIDARSADGDGHVFEALLRAMTKELRELVAVDAASQLDYLTPLLDFALAQEALPVGSLNYDRTVETLCERASVVCHTGVESWSRDRTFAWPDDGVRLLKLHGSIDWSQDRTGLTVPRHLPSDAVEVSSDPTADRRSPAVVFGLRGKLRADGPFLDLLREYERQLERVRCLVVVGYSFRDDHVNEIVRRWMNDEVARHLVVVDPHWDPVRGSFQADLNTYLAGHVYGVEEQPAARLTVLQEEAGTGLRAVARLAQIASR